MLRKFINMIALASWSCIATAVHSLSLSLIANTCHYSLTFDCMCTYNNNLPSKTDAKEKDHT